MYATERQQQIELRLADYGRVAVLDLARDLDVSSETVRRDLDQLEARGVLRRVHGGAVLASRIGRAEESIAQRSDRNASAKERIARAALALVPASFSGAIALDSGTTTGRLAQHLTRWEPEAPGGTLTVITHSIAIATTVSENPHIEVQIVGGRLRGITGAAVGPTTLGQLARLRPDMSFLGANGLTGDFGLSTPDPDEGAVKAAITRGSRRAIALVDASKHGVETLVSFATLADIDILVTDAVPDAGLASLLDGAGVEVVVA